MTRPGVVLVALLVAACSSGRGAPLTEALDAARQAARRGELPGALKIVDQELSHIPPTDNSPLAWQLRLLRGELLVMRRDVNAAASVVNAALPDGAPFEPIKARQQYLKARVAVETGDLERAMSIAQGVRELAGADPDTQFDIDLLVGRIHLQQGHWAEAESTLGPVLAPSTDRYKQLQALNNLGYGRLRRSRYDEALTWLDRALSLSEFEGTTYYATAMANAGICYSRLGLFDRAIQIQKRAVEIQRSQGGPKALVEALGSLGNTYVLQGNSREAVPFLREALSTADQAGLKEDAAMWAVNVSAAHARLGEWDAAEKFNEWSRAVQAGADGARAMYADLNSADIATGRGEPARGRELYEKALRSADGAPGIEWTAHAGLAQVALSERQPQVAARHFETALETVEKTRSELLRTDYKLSFLTQLIEFYQGYVDSLVDQGRSERALEIADSSRGRVLAERQRVDAPARTTVTAFKEVARRSRTVLLSYWLAPRRSFLWVVDANGLRRIDLPPAAEIEAEVRGYRAMVDNSLADPLTRNGTPGDRLFQMLLAPAALPLGASVVIVPDGALHGVNFETLPVDGPRRHYWIEDAEVQVAPSLAMLTVAPRTRPRPRELLLIGNPTPRAPEFAALSYAPAEMTSIVSHFPPDRVTTFDSARATPAVYRDGALDRYSIIHFTAHATANMESPLDSAVVLSGPDTAYKLYARDVADKPLTADLVTVSACRSAGERTYSGEGLVGFAWAFLRAGARRVIAGLWDVDDRSTAQLMDQLYSGLEAGDPPARALRAAKLSLIAAGHQLARPYYWGPFQLFTVSP